MNATLAPAALTNADRCDRCGARAYVRVVLPVGELLFCAHHGRAHSEALRSKAVEIQDETHALTEVPASAPDDER